MRSSRAVLVAAVFAGGFLLGRVSGGGGRPLPGGLPSEIDVHYPSAEPPAFVRLRVVRYCRGGEDPVEVTAARGSTLWRLVLRGNDITFYAEPVTR